MSLRRIFQSEPWSSSRRWLYSCTAQISSPPTAAAEQKPPLLVFSSRDCISRRSFTPSKLNYLNVRYSTKGCYFSSHALADHPVDAIVDVPLAQTGEGIVECELLKWFVEEGNQVEEFQPLCEVQSDKATIEITSRYKGQVSQILHVPGDIVKVIFLTVGETLLKMVVGASSISNQTCDLENLISVGSDTSDSDEEGSLFENTEAGRALSTPAVRNLAKQMGIDINEVCGTGKGGRILREDVLKYVSEKGNFKELPASLGATSAEQMASGGANGFGYQDKKLPLSSVVRIELHTSVSRDELHQHGCNGVVEFVAFLGISGRISRGFQRAMVNSMTLAASIPHFYFVEEINCDALMELKTLFQHENSDSEVKHTFLPVMIKALSMALSKYPMLNSCFSEELHEVTLKGSHNIGVAMATKNGLVVPNIKKVQSLSILEITKELSRLQQLALANKLSPGDISGGTITLSNIGSIGGKFGSPLINVPEVSIIAIGRIQKIPYFGDDGTTYPMSAMTVSIGADHRVLDGATIARFCNEWKLYIEKPELLMLHMR
ncbi:hypothetical protein RJ639_021181 [Escallonia herrerae]|uniref:Dihydrolipoamide acetyltransferase component of pyruvate dehydrogenase complex n=1 Tax=Escallonia herrerae TaxID=1293975 RepID=A0AA89AGD6_9ASTE|nr:hypothetical protein RJ639_021181 [Escallonia herrerae]